VTFITGHEETIAQRFYSLKLFLSTYRCAVPFNML